MFHRVCIKTITFMIGHVNFFCVYLSFAIDKAKLILKTDSSIAKVKLTQKRLFQLLEMLI